MSGQRKVLVVSYSQSGQLDAIAESVVAPLRDDPAIRVDWLRVAPRQPYPFPWSFLDFLDVFPEAVYLEPPPLQPFDVDADCRYDLIILAYTVWFLAPAPPITGFLKSETAHRLLRDTPVMTLIGCRNMWVTAQETVSRLLTEQGARLIDNAVLTDQGSALASFITTPRWLLTGRKDAFWGLPPAGISATDIRDARRFGEAIRAALAEPGPLQGPMLRGLGAVTVNPALVRSERIGHRSFRLWGRLLRRLGGPGTRLRRSVLILYVVFLVAMIVSVVPLQLVLQRLTAPLRRTRDAQLRARLEAPSGSGRERLPT